MKIKLNDQVKVITGKDSGKTGKVTQVLTKTGQVVVAGANLYRRHLKKQSDQNPGGVVSIERPLNQSKVQVICPSCHKPSRIGYTLLPTGEKVRSCKKCAAQLDTKTQK